MNSGEFWILFWATIGGLFVFGGLLLEKFADWMNENFLGGEYKPHKTLEFVGWCILMFGIAIEIADAGWTAHEIRETQKNEEKIEVTVADVRFKADQIPLLISNQSQQLQFLNAENNELLELTKATQPRRITEDQRKNFISLLSDVHVSKIALPVVVGNDDSETENFAEQFREMLNAAGYGTTAPNKLPPPSENIIVTVSAITNVYPNFRGYSTEGIKYIPGLFLRPQGSQAAPEVFAIIPDMNFLANPPHDNPPTFMDFHANPKKHPEGGELLAYHPTDNPNAIVVGICNALIREGISVGFISSKGILPDDQAGFFIPQKLYK